jgi:photosystem II stability/assembly factor-like uncharacterized protein
MIFLLNTSLRRRLSCHGLIFLCISGLLSFASCSLTGISPTPSLMSTKRAVSQGVSLKTLEMFDQKHGWAISFDAAHVLHTTAGVTKFQDVSPQRLVQLSGQGSQVIGSFFLNERLAWIALSAPDPLTATSSPPSRKSVVERTTDGGRNWHETLFPRDLGGRTVLISFPSAQYGWLLLIEGAAAGSEAVEVLRTSDGGASFQTVEKTTPTTGYAPGQLPFGGDKTGITFLDQNVGWITESNSGFYQTQDGGATWYLQRLPIPSPVPGYTGAYVAEIKPPKFFTTKAGILPVVLVIDRPLQLIYHTHDGGHTWQPTPQPLESLLEGGMMNLTDFINPQVGWAASLHNGVVLFSRTTDGGRTWEDLRHRIQAPPPGPLTELNFVSETTGWLLTETNQGQAPPRLLFTSDGGHTWSEVRP